MAQKILTMTPFEALRIAEGNELQCRTLDGTSVTVRLYTPDELMEAQRAATAQLPPGGPDPLTRDQAEKLCRPLGAF